MNVNESALLPIESKTKHRPMDHLIQVNFSELSSFWIIRAWFHQELPKSYADSDFVKLCPDIGERRRLRNRPTGSGTSKVFSPALRFLKHIFEFGFLQFLAMFRAYRILALKSVSNQFRIYWWCTRPRPGRVSGLGLEERILVSVSVSCITYS